MNGLKSLLPNVTYLCIFDSSTCNFEDRTCSYHLGEKLALRRKLVQACTDVPWTVMNTSSCFATRSLDTGTVLTC